MLATKYNSCLYLSQSLSTAAHTLFKHKCEKQEDFVGQELEEAYTQTKHNGPYIQYQVSPKKFLCLI